MRISIVVPCHNAEAYLAQTLRSALEQSLPPAEVIVVDDSSTDRSIEVAGSFGEKVQVVARQNGSAATTRNQGYAMTSGDAVMFLDADDVLAPDALESLAGRPELMDGGVVCCPWHRLELHEGRWVRRPASCAARRQGEDPLKAWLRGWYHPTSSVLWSRGGFERTGGWNREAGVNDDGDLMMRALAMAAPFGVADKGSIYYRRLPDEGTSLSGKRFTRGGLESRLWVVENLAKLLEANGRLDEYRSALGSSLRNIRKDCGTASPDLAERSRELCARFGDPEWRHTIRSAGTGVRSRLGRMRRCLPHPDRETTPEEVRFGLEPNI